MTGSGTQTSPLIFSSWKELSDDILQIAGRFESSSDKKVYYKASDGIDEDLGESYGDNNADMLNFYYNEVSWTQESRVFIDFNNATFRNGRFDSIFRPYPSSRYNYKDRITIENLNIVNCEVLTAVILGHTGTSYSDTPILFYNCTLEPYAPGTNARFTKGTSMSYSDYDSEPQFRNCYIKLIGDFVLSHGAIFHDCIFQTDCSPIFDADERRLSLSDNLYSMETGEQIETPSGITTTLYGYAGFYVFYDSYLFGSYHMQKPSAGSTDNAFTPRLVRSLCEISCDILIMEYLSSVTGKFIINKGKVSKFLGCSYSAVPYGTAATTSEIRTPRFLYQHGLPAQPE